MSKLLIAVKDEIRRVARKEIRAATAGLKKDRKTLRKTVAALRRQQKAHNKTIGQLIQAVARQAKTAVMAPATAEGNKARVTVKGVRALRRKLKLSQMELGKLIGVSGQTILRWEHGAGPLKVRSRTREKLLAARGLGVREARLRLGA
ncbi:MAG: helix-turn-helix domain-containing protein [Lentisphaerae bacterium]|nr:helix-turn-helix domain-containing protein [Lentisphaerota bacterium]